VVDLPPSSSLSSPLGYIETVEVSRSHLFLSARSLTFDIGMTSRAGTFMRSHLESHDSCDLASWSFWGFQPILLTFDIHSPVEFAMFSLKLYMLPNLSSHIIGCDTHRPNSAHKSQNQSPVHNDLSNKNRNHQVGTLKAKSQPSGEEHT
jgi:hypothetical protein